jgi:hypothetical protein
VEQPGPRITRPPCSLPATGTTRATTGRTDGHHYPGSDPHGRQVTGPRRRQPAARPGTAQRTGPGHRTTGKEENRPGPEQRTGRPRRPGARPPDRGRAAAGGSPGRHQARDQVEQLPGTTWRKASPAPGGTAPAEDHPAALLFADDQHDQGDDRTDGHHYPGSEPHGRQPTGAHRRRPAAGPRAKKRATRTATATTTTRTTRSAATGSRPGTCRRITRQAAGEHRHRLRRSGAMTGNRWSGHRAEIGTTWRKAGPAPGGTTRAADHPAARLFADDYQDRTGDHDHREPGSDPHGRQVTGPRRRRPAAGPGTAQRTRPGHRATDKEKSDHDHNTKHDGHSGHDHRPPRLSH